jgi:tetratricopeptide (TPR) repeat protein
MKLRKFFSLLPAGACALLLLLPALARADTADTRLDEANRACQEGRYDEAVVLFQQLITDRGYSAPLCFDLGNAELKAGHLGPALLNYERARYLAPGDADIDHNLQLARKQAGLDPDPYRWWQIVLRSIDWTVWLGIILGALALLFLAILGTAFADAWARILRMAPFPLRRFFKGVIFITIPVILFFAFVELSAYGFNARIEGVIVAKQAPLRLSPFDSADQTGTLPEGELVTVEQRHNDYFWVDDRSRQSGWVQQKALEPVLPGLLPDGP